MRVVQLIDSLEAGGAERMAVNYANALVSRAGVSALAVTRKEGALRDQLSAEVPYLSLNRKRLLDFGALWRLRKFVAGHRIEWLHAHGTSFFFAVLLKLICPKVKIAWHDHNGNRVKMKLKDNRMLVLCSFFFDRVIAVNEELKVWAEQYLKCKNVAYLPNFTVADEKEQQITFLKGSPGKRIVCLANLRHPKNHLSLLKAFLNGGLMADGWSLHFIGKDYLDDYSDTLKTYIMENALSDRVFIYGSCNDVYSVLKQAEIGVLASTYEGFPVTLLEYGLSGLAVVSSNVGYCPEIITDEVSGLLFDPSKPEEMREKLVVLTKDRVLREKLGSGLSETVRKRFSEQAVVADYLHFIC